MFVVRLCCVALCVCVLASCSQKKEVSTEGEREISRPLLLSPRVDQLPPNDRSVLRVVPQFKNVALERGLRFSYVNDAVPGRFFLPEVMGGGAGWCDFDNDGWLDLLLTNGCRLIGDVEEADAVSPALFRNNTGTSFSEVSSHAGLSLREYGQGCACADFNSDGFVDIYLTNYGRNRLLENNGDGTFHDVSTMSRTDDPSWSTGAAWFDADRDGDEDLYVVNYLDVTLENHKLCHYEGVVGYCGPGSFAAVPDRVYLNQSDGRFVEASEMLGLVDVNGKGMSVTVLDLNDDLLPEVYVANDMTANFLFTRHSGSHATTSSETSYREIAVDSGCALSGDGQVEASMGIACADFDTDGKTDLVLTHYFMQKNTLYRNLGHLQFHDDSFRSRVAANTMLFVGFGAVALDFDRDMAPDLFFSNGHVLGPNLQPNEMTPQLLWNDGQGRFDDVSSKAGAFFGQSALGRGVAGGDFDNDGDLDLAIVHLDQPVALLENKIQTARSFLGVELRCKNRVAPVGGRVVVSTSERRQVQSIVSGGSYLASSDRRLLFGLGDSPEDPNVEICWPSGRVDRFSNLTPNNYWLIIEGNDPQIAVWSSPTTALQH